MIIKVEDFKGDNFVPNKELIAPGGDVTGNANLLQLAIDKHEPICLIKILGFDLKEEFISNIDPVTGGVKSGADEKWNFLLNGEEDYIGLKELLVNYIYFYFLESQESHLSGVGNMVNDPKGGKIVTSIPKAVRAWREFFELTVGNHNNPVRITRPYGIGIIWQDNEWDAYKPLYAYLQEKAEDFPSAKPKQIKNINRYGL